MKKVCVVLFSILCSLLSFSQTFYEYCDYQLIVKFKSCTNLDLSNITSSQKFGNSVLDSLNNKFKIQKIKLTGNKRKRDTYILKFETKQNVSELLDIYQNTDLFEFVEPNFISRANGQQGTLQIVPNDPWYFRQYGFYNDGTFGFTINNAVDDADIDMDLAWDIEQGSESITVAVLDTGLKLDHPEFSDRIWNNSTEIINGIDDDGNGYIDDIQGWNFSDSDNAAIDNNGHGTNVTGVIGANANNGEGYAGVDWNCKLMICKVLDENGDGFLTDITEGIYYAVDNGAKIINISIGGYGFSNLEKEAVDYAYNNGVVVVAAMGNNDTDLIEYPAGYENVIAVGSTSSNDERTILFANGGTSSGSNYGEHIDVVAPGNMIFGLSHTSDTDYSSFWSGTSQSAPLVSGLAALLLAQDSTRTPDDIRTIIRNTAEDQVGNLEEDIPGFDVYYGYGRINAHQALLQSTLSTQNTVLGEDIHFTIYPNPISDYLFIKSNVHIESISIINILGLEIYKEDVLSPSEELEIDISTLPKGIYFIVLSNNNKEITRPRKIVKG